MPSGWTTFWTGGGNRDFQDYEQLIQFWEAVRERHRALGTDRWPRHSESWYQGTVTSVVADGNPADTYTLTDSGADWTGGHNPWDPSVIDEVPWLPTSWQVVIEWDLDDYRHFVIARIQSWTATTLTIQSITDYLTSKEFDALGTLAGKTFHIYRDDGYGLWWQQRWPEYPQAPEQALGTIVGVTVDADAGITTIQVANGGWRAGQFVPSAEDPTQYDFITLADEDGWMRRVTITANTEKTISFPTPAWTVSPGTSYAVVVKDGVYRLGRPKWLPFAWYRGGLQTYFNHAPDDTIGIVPLPKLEVTFSVGTAPVCEDESFTLFDVDLWSADDETCSDADYPYATAHLFKTFRALQNDIVELAPSFIEARDWNDSPYMEKFSSATHFKAANINSQTGTTGTNVSEGNISVSGITLPDVHPLPIGIYYAIVDPTDGTLLSGAASLGEDMILNHGLPAGTGADALQGKDLVVSFGWTRFKARTFRYFYPTQFFIPDVDPMTGVIDPARVVNFAESGPFGVGLWSRREASTRYLEDTSGAPGELEDFVEGELARWVGDNWGDGIVPLDSTENGQGPLTEYYDHPNVMSRPSDTAGIIRGQMGGTAKGANNGSAFRLQDRTKTWYTTHWYGGGVGHTETGTATSGSTSSLSDTAVRSDQERGSFWDAAARFPAFAGAYVDFIVEVELPTEVPVLDGDGNPTFDPVSGDPLTEIQPVWHKRPITSTSISTSAVTINWDDPLPATANGRNWRIREPKYELSRWQGRTLHVTQTVVIDEDTGETQDQSFDVVITHSDDDTLFFDEAPYDVVEGATYLIQEAVMGGVYRRQDGEWKPAKGDDAVRTGVAVPQPFRDDLRANLPTIVKRFGPMMKGDYNDYEEFYDQLYRAINALIWTLREHSWVSDVPPDPPGTTINRKFTGTPLSGTEAYPRSKNAVAWGGGGAFVDEAGNPIVVAPAFDGSWNAPPLAMTHRERTATTYSESLDRLSSRAKVQDIPTLMASSLKLYTWSEISLTTDPADGSYFEDGQVVTSGSDTTEWDFNTHGDDVAFRNWYLWSTEAPDTTDTRYSGFFNGLPIPDEVPYPAAGSGTNTVNAGYAVVNQKAVLAWNVAGGMKYVP